MLEMASSYNSYREYDEEIDEHEEEKEDQEFNLKDCILFAIDGSESMLQENSEGDIPILVALKSIRSTLLNKVNDRPSDLVGVVLCGTRENNNMAGKDHIYIMQSLDIPDAPRVKEIDSLIEDLSTFKEKYGPSNQSFSIGDLFWVCSDIMSSAPKFATKRIFLITDNDDPTGGNSIIRKSSIQRAKDLGNAGIEITLFGLDKPDNSFDTELFYKDIASFEDSDDNAGSASSTGKLTELLDRVKSSQVKNRSEFRLPFQLTPEVTFGIRGYNMVIEQKLAPAKNFYTGSEQVQEVKSTVRWVCSDTNESLTPLDMKLAYDYGGEKVVFSKEELGEILKVRDPSLLLLGFKQKSSLKPHHQISHPYFIYPDETQYEGSNSIFFSLMDVLVKRKRIAICSFLRRANTMPKIVALIPQAEKIDGNGKQIDPPGFQLIILPFAEEIRDLPKSLENVPVVDDNSRESAKVIIDKLKIKEGYDPVKFENPYIRNHKNIIQKLALETEDDIENKPVDNSVPNYKLIESDLADDIEEFKKYVGLENITVDDITDYKTTAPKKRERPNDEESVKRAKLEESNMEEDYKSGKWKKATNQYLKDFLTTVGIQPKKLKADLQAQVEEFFESKK